MDAWSAVFCLAEFGRGLGRWLSVGFRDRAVTVRRGSVVLGVKMKSELCDITALASGLGDEGSSLKCSIFMH